MTDTPETNAESNNGSLCDQSVPIGFFARKLKCERERDAYEEALRRIYVIASDGEEIWSDIEQIAAIAHNALNHHE